MDDGWWMMDGGWWWRGRWRDDDEGEDDDDDGSCRPEGRVAASLTAIGDEIILQGGYDPVTKETYDETWVLNDE